MSGEVWIVIDDASGAMLAGPFEDEPTVDQGEIALEQPPGYGTEWLWDPVHRGRKDVASTAPLITVGRFLLRIPFAKQVAIHAAAQTDMEVQTVLFMLQGFTAGISLSDPLLAQFLQMMVSKNLLAEEDVSTVLEAGQ